MASSNSSAGRLCPITMPESTAHATRLSECVPWIVPFCEDGSDCVGLRAVECVRSMLPAFAQSRWSVCMCKGATNQPA